MESKNASGDRKHIDKSYPGTGTVPGRAGWTAGRRSCEAKHTPQRGRMASEKLVGAYTCCEVFDQLRLGREGVVWGSSEKFMSDDPNSSPFLAQRRGGAEKNQEEPHNIPMLIRLDMGMGDEPCIHFSAPPRENQHDMASLTRSSRKSRKIPRFPACKSAAPPYVGPPCRGVAQSG